MVAVLGSGSWGTALAKSLADSGHEVRLWARRAEQAEAIERERENGAYLPGARLPATLGATHDLESALDGVDMVLSAVPTVGLRENLEIAARYFPLDVPILSATKGIENGTLKLVCGIFEDCLPRTQHRQLTYLGGSPYYLIAGAGFLISGLLVLFRRREGVALYGVMLFATIAWAIWEVGFDGWALLPRVVAPVLFGLILFSAW